LEISVEINLQKKRNNQLMHKQIKAWAISWLRVLVGELYLQKPVFSPRPVRVGFVVDRVELG
jgi:ribosomal protein L16/L10AE